MRSKKIVSKVRNKKKQGKIKIDKLKISMGILISCFIFLIIWFNRGKLSPENVINWIEDQIASMGKGEGYPCNIVGKNVSASNFKLMDNNILVLSDTSLVCLNNTGKEVSSRNHNLSNPIMKTRGGRAIMYDMGGKEIKICTRSKNIKDINTDSKIMCCDISLNGAYGVVTESNGYLSEMTIYNKNGKVKYKYYFSEYYINGITMGENGDSVAVCGVSAQDGEIKSAVYVFKFNSDMPSLMFEYNDNMFMDIQYFSNGNIIAIGDKMVSIINTWMKNKQDISYEQKILTGYYINNNDGIVYSLSAVNSGQNCDIFTIDKSGRKKSEIQTNYTVNSIAYRGNRIVGIDGRKVFSYNLSGNLIGEWEIENDAKRIELKSPTLAYLLGISKIDRIKLK